MYYFMRDLFINACILFTFTCLGFYPFRYQRLNKKRMKYLLGLITGIVGIILMVFTIQLPDKLILDLHLIPIIVAASYGGMTASFVSSLIVVIGRILLFGNNATATVSILVIGIVAPILGRFIKNQKYKMLILNLYSLVQSMIIHRNTPIDLLSLYCLSVIVMGVLVQFQISKLIRYFDLQVYFKELSKLDSLTGLLNVRQFEYGLNFEMQLFKENREPFSLLMIDIDKFKNLNDTYGHLVGDSVLKQLATLLKRNCRSGDLVCRKGGEEFAIILPSCSKETAIEIAERIRHEVEIHQFDEQKRFGVTISIGVAIAANESLMDSERLIDLADKELYKAKNNGRNKVCIA